MLSETIDDTTYSYTYDNVGNLLSASDGTTSHTYRYNHGSWGDYLSHYDGQLIEYDAIGNPISYYNGTRWAMTWQNGRQLATASDGTNSISYEYDQQTGSRIKKVVNGTTYNYYYASGRLIRMEAGNDILDFFYDHNGQPYAVNYNGTRYYYITNLQGDVVRIVNAAGTSMG